MTQASMQASVPTLLESLSWIGPRHTGRNVRGDPRGIGGTAENFCF